MTDALSVIGSFVLGLLVGGGIIGGCIVWWLAKDEWVIEALVRFMVARPEVLDLVVLRVRSAQQAEAALERTLIDKLESLRRP